MNTKQFVGVFSANIVFSHPAPEAANKTDRKGAAGVPPEQKHGLTLTGRPSGGSKNHLLMQPEEIRTNYPPESFHLNSWSLQNAAVKTYKYHPVQHLLGVILN